MAEENGTIGLKVSKGVRIQWNIEGDVIRLPRGNGECISSPSFHAFNTSWKIRIYPNGNDPSANGYISLFLRVISEEIYPSVCASFFIKLGDTMIKEGTFDKKDKPAAVSYGFLKFIETSKVMERLMPATPDLNVICHIHPLESRTEETVGTQTSRTDERAVENFKSLYFRKELCDVSIKVGMKCYRAHKAILSARSPVFSSMFSHQTAESINGSVEIPDCDSESFEAFLRYIYTGNSDYVCPSNALSLYKTADKYLLDDLKKECCIRMSEQMDVHSFCDVLDLATTHNETGLLEHVILYFIKNCNEVLATEKWMKLMAEKPLLANDCIMKMARRYNPEVKGQK